MLTGWLHTGIYKVIGWSIIHSLWQSLILLAALKLVLLVIAKRNSATRYFISLVALCGVVICSVFSFINTYQSFIVTNVSLPIDATGFAEHASPVYSTPGNFIPDNAMGWFFINFLTGLTPYLSFCWMAGVLFCMTRIIWGGLYLARLRKLPAVFYAHAQEKMEEIARKLGIGKRIRLVINEKVTQPLTFGFFKPVVLLPLSYTTQVPMEQLQMILAHELAHIKRHDYLINLLQSSLETIYFFNPFFQWISRIIREEREYCCDDIAAEICGNKNMMAIALTNLKILTMHPRLSLAAAPAKTAFHQRIHRLLSAGSQPGLSFKKMLFSIFVISLALVILTKCTPDRLQNELLPTQTDSFKQLLADNQAGHKVEVLSYQKAGQVHEIFLVSTVEGKPQYAFLDGIALSSDKLDKIYKLIRQSRTITPAELAALPPSKREADMKRAQELNRQWEDVGQEITAKEMQWNLNRSSELQNQLTMLKAQSSLIGQQIKSLAMEQYKEQVKDIPVSVELHILLNRIINSKQYTPEDRAKLDELIERKQKM